MAESGNPTGLCPKCGFQTDTPNHVHGCTTAPSSSGLDREAARQPWRVGKHYGIHVYEEDRPVATFHTVEDAKQAVADHNGALTALVDADATNERLRAENGRLTAALGRAFNEKSTL